MKLKFLTLVLSLSSALAVQAANYYVDYSAGVDTNAGTSTSAAWKHCPGDPAATGTALSKTLAAGDTVFFKGGVTYTLTGSTGIILKWNGSSGSPITYDGNSSGTWGTGKAKITDGNRNPGLFAMRATSSDLRYVTIKSFLFKDLGGAATLPADPGSAIAPNSGAGIYANGRMTGVTIDGCDFSQLGYWFNKKPMSAGSIVGAGIEFDGGCSGTTISNCNFSRMMIGIECQYTTSGPIDGLTIFGCTFTDSITWCIDLGPTSSGATMTNVAIRNNKFTDYYQFDQDYWTGYGEWPHTDGIFLRCDYFPSYWGTINIWNNEFSSTTTTAGGTASIYITEGPSANIYNNLFIHQGKSRAISLANGMHTGSSPQIVRIINNTFLCDYTTQIDWGQGTGSNPVASGTGSSVTVLNNIFVDLQAVSSNNFMMYSASTTLVGPLSFDYNSYQTGNRAGKFFQTTATGQADLAQVRSSTGWEANGKYASPSFVSTIPAGSNPSLANLRLQSSSPARSAGTNLSALAVTLTGLDKDCSGVQRPLLGAWDLGAYHFTTGAGQAPSNAVLKISLIP